MQTSGYFQIFMHGQFGISGWTLDEMPDLCPRPASIRTDSLIEHFDISRARANHTQQRADRCRFARAIETEEAINLTRFDAQVDRVDRAHITIIFCQVVCFDCIVHFVFFHLPKIKPRLFLYWSKADLPFSVRWYSVCGIFPRNVFSTSM